MHVSLAQGFDFPNLMQKVLNYAIMAMHPTRLMPTNRVSNRHLYQLVHQNSYMGNLATLDEIE